MGRNTMKQSTKKLINLFIRRHKYIDAESGGDSDCEITYNDIHRVAPRKEWLGDNESWKKAMKEQKERDDYCGCYVCAFIKQLRKDLK
jgi:hypothetical protein